MGVILTKPLMPFMIKSILERAKLYFPNTEIFSLDYSGEHRYNYAGLYERTCRLANALSDLGIKRGDIVGTFAWNTHRHLELYFALPSMGSIIHTLNIYLFKEQLVYILNHAEDKILFVDEDLIPAIEALKDEIPKVKAYVILTDKSSLPETTLTPVYHYEELLAKGAPDYKFPEDIDEREACFLVYSSGTTGMPKGYFYSHRSLYLYSLTICFADAAALKAEDSVLMIVPMFHAAAWAFPYAATLTGAKQVYPGIHPSTKILCELIESERVTVGNGVPTIWLGILNEVSSSGADISSLQRVATGASPVPAVLAEELDRMGVTIMHHYGITETTYGDTTYSKIRDFMKSWPKEKQYEQLAKQGIPLPLAQMRVVNPITGTEVKWDGKEPGAILWRSPALNYGYFKDEERTREVFDKYPGFIDSQDLGTVDEYGYVKIVDRAKDLIKSGGEWISSVDLENMIMGHEKVLEAAVFAVPHPKWDERPGAWVVPKPEFKGKLTKQEILDYLTKKLEEGKIAKFWIPDIIEIVERIPKTGTGKFDKKVIRKKYWKSSKRQDKLVDC